MAVGIAEIVGDAEIALEPVVPNPAAVARLADHPIPVVAERVAGAAWAAVGPTLAAVRIDAPNHSGSWLAEMPPFQPLQRHTWPALRDHYAHAARCRERPAPPLPQ